MVYRFKIWFENQEDIIRWIDAKPSTTFIDFHNAIQDAIGFDKKELASFYVSDAKWKRLFEIMLEDMSDNESQSAEMIEICPNQVHTGTPHIFCLTTTAIICVFVKQ